MFILRRVAEKKLTLNTLTNLVLERQRKKIEIEQTNPFEKNCMKEVYWRHPSHWKWITFLNLEICLCLNFRFG